MDKDRKRKSTGDVGTVKGWDDRKRKIGRDAGNPRDGEECDAAGDRRAAEDDVEDEVEEFFAIVRRMHATARQFSAFGGRAARQAPREDEAGGLGRWRPTFEWEDFQEAGHHNPPEAGERSCGGRAEAASAAIEGGGGRREERAAESGVAARLDLNAEPEPESVQG